MKKIVFFAPYPNSSNIKEGMMQRVDAVDKMFPNTQFQKIYIVPRFKNLKTTRRQVDFNTEEIILSIWTSYYLLIKLLKYADIIYSHSIYGISLTGFSFLYILNKKNFIWDVHGIVPEELHLAGYSKLKQYIYNTLERAIAYKAKKIVVVTNVMYDHLRKKHPHITAKFLIYPILPITINNNIKIENTKDETINLLYSGNIQGYQNIPLMIESIKKLVDDSRLHFYILTGQKEEMNILFKQAGIENKKNITIESVAPSDLHKYYTKAHYGYILRDDVDVNNVACPTKIVEYLAYGLTCITKSNNIGDFGKIGFDYINIENLNSNTLTKLKSQKNVETYRKISNSNNIYKFTSFIFEY